MKLSCIPHGLALAAALLVSSSGALAATDLKPLSDSEMSGVYGQGLSQPTLAALAALSSSEQGGAFASAPAGDLLASASALSTDGAQSLDRQMAQQRIQTAASGMQTTVKLAETLATVSKILSPLGALTVLGAMQLPLFGLPALPTLPTLPNTSSSGKH